jgi:ribonucleotide reductase beta subunit family protein with ferritin-like domain
MEHKTEEKTNDKKDEKNSRILDIIEIDDDRPSLPIHPRYAGHYKLLKIQHKLFWTEDEIKIEKIELEDFAKLGQYKMILVKCLVFFIKADDWVMEYLEKKYMGRIKVREIRAVYGFQGHMEEIHSKTYMTVFNSYITDAVERKKYIDDAYNEKNNAAKRKWALQASDDDSIYDTAVRIACAEHLFFTTIFVFIDYLNHKKFRLNALFTSNEFISRDENYHVETHCETANVCSIKSSYEQVVAIIKSAYDVELINIQYLFQGIVPEDNIMTVGNFITNLQYMANKLLNMLTFQRLMWANITKSPFEDITAKRSFSVKTNFFELTNAEYTHNISAEYLSEGVDWGYLDQYYGVKTDNKEFKLDNATQHNHITLEAKMGDVVLNIKEIKENAKKIVFDGKNNEVKQGDITYKKLGKKVIACSAGPGEQCFACSG